MKKSIIFMMAAVGLLTACDPSKDDISMPSSSLSEQQLSDGFSFKQYDETYTQEKADGNYFTFFTSPSRVVRIYQKDADGVENVLVAGVANGKFKIVPKRGNPNDQTFYVETMNFDGSKVVITSHRIQSQQLSSPRSVQQYRVPPECRASSGIRQLPCNVQSSLRCA